MAEQKRVLNLVPSQGTETDWSYEDAVGGGLAKARVSVPERVDLRRSWWKVGDQGFTGSCVGWAAADGVGRYVLTEAGKITRNQRLSPRFVWMASKERDEFRDRPTSFVEEAGTSLKAAMNVARRYGYALEKHVPFEVETTMWVGAENALFASAARRRISYVNLRLDLKRWKSWLATNGPILAGLWVDDTWMNLGSNGLLDTWDAGSAYGGHAVTIVGYRKDGRFIIRNSWGTQWGHQGFAYATPDYLRNGFFPESYGASVD